MNVTLSIASDEVSASVWVDRWESDGFRSGRWAIGYRVTLDPSGAAVVIAGTDLRSGTVSDGAAPDLPDMLRGLLSFLSADAESYAHAERRGGVSTGPDGDPWAHPAETMELLEQVGSDGFYMLAQYVGAE